MQTHAQKYTENPGKQKPKKNKKNATKKEMSV